MGCYLGPVGWLSQLGRFNSAETPRYYDANAIRVLVPAAADLLNSVVVFKLGSDHSLRLTSKLP